MSRERPMQQPMKVLIDRFIRMLPGQSFFIADVSRLDVEFMRRPVVLAGCNIKIVQVECDEIYCQSGVRIWREEGEYDEL